MQPDDIPIEDFYQDILGKAIRGLGVDRAILCEEAGASLSVLESMLEGTVDEATTHRIAPLLGLSSEQLLNAAKKTWRPRPVDLDGLVVFNSVYKDMRVNAFLVCQPGQQEAVLFDTGTEPAPIIECVRERGLTVKHIFLTHTHSDHIAALSPLVQEWAAPQVHISTRESIDEATAFRPGSHFEMAGLQIGTRSTWGHSPGGTTYVVDGLAKPVAIVGDAVFAGSMGGGIISYHDALRTNKEEIMTLPEETILCPGHGPLTTVAEEKIHNPFFAGV